MLLTVLFSPISVHAYTDGNGSEVDALGNRYELVPDPDGSGGYVFQCTDPNGIKYYPGSVGTQGLGGGKYTNCVDPDTRAKITGPYAYKYCTHEYVEEITKEATCAEAGEKKYTCSKCGHSYTEEIPAGSNHHYVAEDTKAATCTEPGVETYTCSICGDSYEAEIPAIEHEYEVVSNTEATCTEAGVKSYKCKYCGDTYEETVKALGHKEPAEWTVVSEPTMFKSGLEQKKCERCGEVLYERAIERKSLAPLVIGVFVGVVALIVIVGVITKRNKNQKARVVDGHLYS